MGSGSGEVDLELLHAHLHDVAPARGARPAGARQLAVHRDHRGQLVGLEHLRDDRHAVAHLVRVRVRLRLRLRLRVRDRLRVQVRVRVRARVRLRVRVLTSLTERLFRRLRKLVQ